MKKTLAIGLLSFLGACGSSTQTAARTGDESTGARHEQRAGLETSGGDIGQEGNCDVAPVYFAYDSSELDGTARSALESNARCLSARNAGARVIGMTDPRGTEEYNLALGDRRAQTVTRYMANLGVEESALSTHSLGEETARGEDENGWVQDRRAEIQVQ